MQHAPCDVGIIKSDSEDPVTRLARSQKDRSHRAGKDKMGSVKARKLQMIINGF